MTASTRCGAACASGELSAAQCDEVREACADGRLSAVDCMGIDGDLGMPDMGMEQGAEIGACGACGGTSPFCDEARMVCVACLNSTQCSGSTPVCSGGMCVGCESSEDCTVDPELPSCDVQTRTCVQCDMSTEVTDCGDTPSTPVCTARECVECRANAQCMDVDASRCVGDGCESCMSDTDCGHLSGTPRCAGGVCRECTVATEAADCGGRTCDPATRECTNTAIGSREVCESCVSDRDCSQVGGTFRRVLMNFMEVDRGGYCLRVGPTCPRPFLTPIMAASLSGVASATYCGIDQSTVSCEAVNALRAGLLCPSGDASDCMADGALCETVELGANECTYSCSVATRCPEGLGCATGSPPLSCFVPQPWPVARTWDVPRA